MEWLVVYRDSYQRDRNGYRATISDTRFHPTINSWLPCVRGEDGAFVGMAKVYEFHVVDDGVYVFFTLDTKAFTGKDAAAISRLYCLVSGRNGGTGKQHTTYAATSGYKGSSTMDPAMSMSMGYGRSPEEIARRAGRKDHRDDDDGSIGIEDIMRMQGGYDV